MGDSKRNLLRSLINASEKAANIARICRSNEQLLKLLVQEKTNDEANSRFEHDFKTLADVLIQETIKHDVGAEDTADCLLQILQPEHQEAATLLAQEVHRTIKFDKELPDELPELPNEVDYSQFGVWIDPIDDGISRSHLLGIFSSSERAELLQQLLDLGYEFAFSAGAGHKALKVITSEVDAYVLSKGSTFKWDTCAP
ncbi:Inositol polyphosphate 1-phosphatase [Eumeta japonica]|uniref:Inositol polyphosphate 1-phosphatase n=1 Tax=Eumeta variegata TaxID=151549 RepID=A0A4C1TQD3_EUMVA|nr:Inositol polyphosphate 1-phosphatase [Eumeta japonica]